MFQFVGGTCVHRRSDNSDISIATQKSNQAQCHVSEIFSVFDQRDKIGFTFSSHICIKLSKTCSQLREEA
jgi:hypothetical protein